MKLLRRFCFFLLLNLCSLSLIGRVAYLQAQKLCDPLNWCEGAVRGATTPESLAQALVRVGPNSQLEATQRLTTAELSNVPEKRAAIEDVVKTLAKTKYHSTKVEYSVVATYLAVVHFELPDSPDLEVPLRRIQNRWYIAY